MWLSRLRRTIGTPYRLFRAALTYGPLEVFTFVWRMVKRDGWLSAMRFALRNKHGTVGSKSVNNGRTRCAVTADRSISRAAWQEYAARTRAREDVVHARSPPIRMILATSEDSSPAAKAALLMHWRTVAPEAMPELIDFRRWRTQRNGPNTWVLFTDASDRPLPTIAEALTAEAEGGRCEILTFDMIVDIGGEKVRPISLSGANPTLAAVVDYMLSRLAVRADSLPQDLEGSLNIYTWLKAWIDIQPATQLRGRWRHVGRPLLAVMQDPSDFIEAARTTLLKSQRAILASVEKHDPSVDVVICTYDKGHLIRQLGRHLLESQSPHIRSVSIVANNVTNPYAIAALEDLQRDLRVVILRRDEPFNFSKLSNIGAAEGSGQEILLLNDDIAPVTDDWLARMRAALQGSAVGAVGPLLLYPNERVQHAGMYLGFRGVAGHTLRHARLPDEDYLFTAVAPREVSCLTGAVMLVRRDAFNAVGGFDEMLATYLQDVDLGLRLNRSGWTNVFEPAAVLIHMESVSVISALDDPAFITRRQREYTYFNARWAKVLDRPDPFHPAAFGIEDELLRWAG